VKYKHMLPGVFELEPPAVAVMTLLLLRGPQTVGELRGRSDRLYEFSGLGEVQETLDELAGRDEPLVLKLERQAGQKEARYVHLLSGNVESEIRERPRDAPTPQSLQEDDLSTEIKRLADEFAAFRAEFVEFKKQFE